MCTVSFISAGHMITLNYKNTTELYAICFKGTQGQTIWNEVVQGGNPEGNFIFSPMPAIFLFNKAFLLNTQKSKHRDYNAMEASE